MENYNSVVILQLKNCVVFHALSDRYDKIREAHTVRVTVTVTVLLMWRLLDDNMQKPPVKAS